MKKPLTLFIATFLLCAVSGTSQTHRRIAARSNNLGHTAYEAMTTTKKLPLYFPYLLKGNGCGMERDGLAAFFSIVGTLSLVIATGVFRLAVSTIPTLVAEQERRRFMV